MAYCSRFTGQRHRRDSRRVQMVVERLDHGGFPVSGPGRTGFAGSAESIADVWSGRYELAGGSGRSVVPGTGSRPVVARTIAASALGGPVLPL